MKNLLIIIYLLSSHHLIAQIDTTKIYDFTENEPEFPGGESAMAKFMQENVQYPKGAGDATGIVYVQFVVRRDGSLDQIKVIRGVNEALNKEAMRIISIMPNWKPASANGVNVHCRYTLPIRFQLN